MTSNSTPHHNLKVGKLYRYVSTYSFHHSPVLWTGEYILYLGVEKTVNMDRSVTVTHFLLTPRTEVFYWMGGSQFDKDIPEAFAVAPV